MRAFWREQRVAVGLMAAESPEARVMKAVETGAARSSDGVVTLSQAAIDILAERYGDQIRAKSRVIPTCVDLDLFAPAAPAESPPLRVLLAGTLNGLYDVPTMLRLVERLRQRVSTTLTVLAAGPTPWRDQFEHFGASVTAVSADRMPEQIAAHHLGLSVVRDVGVSNAAATPTKIGEFLACGRPIVVNCGLGDMEQLLKRYDCGVALRGGDVAELDRAADEIVRLFDDPTIGARCRALATEHFNLERGVDTLLELYHAATDGRRGRRA
jgi:glycosyltransferase involved in cell wall biosynthesis